MFSHIVLVIYNNSIFLGTLIQHSIEEDWILSKKPRLILGPKKPNRQPNKKTQQNPSSPSINYIGHKMLTVLYTTIGISKLCLAEGSLSKPHVVNSQSSSIGTYRHPFQRWEQIEPPFCSALGLPCSRKCQCFQPDVSNKQ